LAQHRSPCPVGAQGLDLLLVFGGEYQVKDAAGVTVRNLSAAAYVGNFQAPPTHKSPSPMIISHAIALPEGVTTHPPTSSQLAPHFTSTPFPSAFTGHFPCLVTDLDRPSLFAPSSQSSNGGRKQGG
jgi:hypothetical protein